jgi:riboflavin synthase
MFTGLIEAVGRVRRAVPRQGGRLLVIEAGFAPELALGESVAVNGVCLTVTGPEPAGFAATAVKATVAATTLGSLGPGSAVNLERALRAGDRLGGHIVQGHVDEVGRVRRVERRADHWAIAVEVDRRNSRLVLPKGSVAVDGVSLTVAATRPGEFCVNVIPHSWEHTTLSQLRPGARVNVEYDSLVKAVQAGPAGRDRR